MTKQELIDKYQEKKKKIDDFYKDQTYHDQGYWQSVAKYEVIEEILKDLEKLDQSKVVIYSNDLRNSLTHMVFEMIRLQHKGL